MKLNKNKLLKLAGLYIILLSVSCKKNTACTYETTCQETAPAGYMVGTMASDAGSLNRVATIFKTAHNSLAPIGDNWNDPSAGANRVDRIFPRYWVSDSIGQVFGIALDNNNGIYLSATDLYKYDELFGSPPGQPTGYGAAGGASGIYYTNYTTPNVTTPLVTSKPFPYVNTVGTSKIPNSGTGTGNSIGNIAYDFANKQLFATNLEDGRIYRINPSSGIVLSIFDPFALDIGTAAPGMAPLGEQLWGIGVLTKAGVTSVYFARTTATSTKEIWSIPLDAAGEFVATPAGGGLFTDISVTAAKKEINAVPGTQSKITDIAFSSAGRMLVAERGAPHTSRITEYVFSGTWVTGNSFYVGDNAGAAGQNSAGGVDYSNREVINAIPNFLCNDIIWATGNVMLTNTLFTSYPNYVYGAQGMASTGNNAVVINNRKTDLFIDYNATGWPHANNVKGKIGDVEFFDPVCPCK